jgi:hypothetical protein
MCLNRIWKASNPLYSRRVRAATDITTAVAGKSKVKASSRPWLEANRFWEKKVH